MFYMLSIYNQRNNLTEERYYTERESAVEFAVGHILNLPNLRDIRDENFWREYLTKEDKVYADCFPMDGSAIFYSIEYIITEIKLEALA